MTLYTESLLETEAHLSVRGRGYLQTIERAMNDVAQTVSRMREFYRQREPQMTLNPVSLNNLVQQVVDLTRARWSDMPQQRGIVVRLVTELASGLPAIMGVESEIREALTNLVFNAVDAMPNGGVLTLRTKTVEVAPATPGSPAVRNVELKRPTRAPGWMKIRAAAALNRFLPRKANGEPALAWQPWSMGCSETARRRD